MGRGTAGGDPGVFSEEELAQAARSPEPVPGDLIRYFMLDGGGARRRRKFRGQETRWEPAGAAVNADHGGIRPGEIQLSPATASGRALSARLGVPVLGASKLWHPAGKDPTGHCGRWRWT